MRSCREGKGTDPNLREIVIKEADTDYLLKVLGFLDLSLIQTGANPFLTQRGVNAVLDIIYITIIIEEAADSPHLQAFKAPFYPILVEHWPVIAQWFSFIIGLQTRTPSSARLCCSALDLIAQGAAAGNAYMESISTAECTIGILYEIVCKKDHKDPDRYYSIPHIRGQGVCAVARVLYSYAHAPSAWSSRSVLDPTP